MSVSGHKIGAPKGIGALYVKKGLRLPPLTFGGGQEKGMRPGTEAVPNIAAFAKACEIRMAHFDEDYAHVQELADYLKQQVSAELPDAAINGEGDIPHVVNLSMPGCKSACRPKAPPSASSAPPRMQSWTVCSPASGFLPTTRMPMPLPH